MDENLAAKFWQKVWHRLDDECWPYLGGVNGKGYGHFAIRRKQFRAHRIAFLLSKGQIAEGLDVLHTCDNRLCCNPRHLYLGTDIENARDRVERGRSARGSRNARAKLTEAQASRIRELALGGMQSKKIAETMQVHRATVDRIRAGSHWRHLL